MNKKIVLPVVMLSLLTACDDNSKTEQAKDDIPEVKIAVLSDRCEPMNLTVKSGKTRFIIENKSNNAVEWEILQGIRIIDERENIPPGFKRKMTTYLDHGNYEITCGLLTNPRGTMVVELAEGAEKFRKPTDIELAGALAEFKVYSMMESATLLADSKALANAIEQGDLATSQQLYVKTFQSYEHIEPFIKQFSEVDRNIAADEKLFKGGSDNPEFKGLHRIEKVLFNQKTTSGLAPIAQQLITDIEKLTKVVAEAKTSSRQLVNFTVALIRESQESKVMGVKNPYAQTDLNGIKANIDGSLRLFNLTKLMLHKAGPELLVKSEASYKKVEDLLNGFQIDGVMPLFNQLSTLQKDELKQSITELLQNLEQLPQVLGVE